MGVTGIRISYTQRVDFYDWDIEAYAYDGTGFG